MSPTYRSISSTSSGFSGFSGSRNMSASSVMAERPSAYRVIRRKKSMAELERDEERGFDGALVGLVEPRPYAGPALGGIEEVLEGRL
ncbi:hypothetical protein LTR12_009136 [Friedmanniomyces endolithicus]|nr:hypothetical protein LTR74_006471 [Friedmanniomyces endolithicus]KAK1816456.1 hypothetical protein LTR12_009136 [Friedmanniomyces endolithicus]